jgi:hypothetical protein
MDNSLRPDVNAVRCTACSVSQQQFLAVLSIAQASCGSNLISKAVLEGKYGRPPVILRFFRVFPEKCFRQCQKCREHSLYFITKVSLAYSSLSFNYRRETEGTLMNDETIINNPDKEPNIGVDLLFNGIF